METSPFHMFQLCYVWLHAMWLFSSVWSISKGAQHDCQWRALCAWGIRGGGGGGSPCRMSIIRNGNVTLLNLRNLHVAMSISRKCHVPCHYLFYPLLHVAKG